MKSLFVDLNYRQVLSANTATWAVVPEAARQKIYIFRLRSAIACLIFSLTMKIAIAPLFSYPTTPNPHPCQV
jgi:hypothetical protein